MQGRVTSDSFGPFGGSLVLQAAGSSGWAAAPTPFSESSGERTTPLPRYHPTAGSSTCVHMRRADRVRRRLAIDDGAGSARRRSQGAGHARTRWPPTVRVCAGTDRSLIVCCMVHVCPGGARGGTDGEPRGGARLVLEHVGCAGHGLHLQGRDAQGSQVSLLLPKIEWYGMEWNFDLVFHVQGRGTHSM
jgi:hypothetical protein